jgi:hypothetical protein
VLCNYFLIDCNETFEQYFFSWVGSGVCKWARDREREREREREMLVRILTRERERDRQREIGRKRERERERERERLFITGCRNCK